MQQGYLVIQTYGSRESFGIKDSKVTVSSGDVLYTDENGFTATIALDAPDRELSESPGGATPYSLVDITVEKEGFFTIIIRNVQIFSGETTEQKVQMLSIPENGGSGTIEYNLPSQNL